MIIEKKKKKVKNDTEVKTNRVFFLIFESVSALFIHIFNSSSQGINSQTLNKLSWKE